MLQTPALQDGAHCSAGVRATSVNPPEAGITPPCLQACRRAAAGCQLPPHRRRAASGHSGPGWAARPRGLAGAPVGQDLHAGLPAAAGGAGGPGRSPRAGWGERALLSNAGMQRAECGGAGLIWCPTKPPFFPSRCISYSGCLLLSRVSLILPLSPPFPFRPSANGKGMSSSLQEGN